MDGVRARITGFVKDLLGLNDFVDLGLERFFDVDDINP